MRVLHFLALTLWEVGARDEAIKEAKTLLRLNPNDNQGIRELLHIWYPATGDWDALTKLLRRYRSDWSVSHLYTSWLLGFSQRQRRRRAVGGGAGGQSPCSGIAR